MLDFDFSRSYVRGLVLPKTTRTLGNIQSYSKSIKELVLAKSISSIVLI